eukprot:TRINITY_DN8368_c0_g1_i1.p1 TRINITY_DN8368_c0_g1~~TRINITY_DN8368_c0_g1_i1.p1  ORF type:complete len:509 (+),score=168.68 TRINITY_DN8368_c0_g1_i1:48-1529(+)
MNEDLEPIQLSSIARWQEQVAESPELDPLGSNEPEVRSKFPFDEKLNQKIALWQGDLIRLEADAIVNSTNESLSDRSGLCGEIFRAAGPELAAEVSRLEGCRTGESKATKGYALPARFVVHTVGPRYNVKYRTAAENALHNCYRSSLQVAVENQMTSVAFCVVNSVKRGYPREDGAHIALRTVRRFLEHFGETLDLVVFSVNNEQDFDIYNRILPLYFPRSFQEETDAIELLPSDTGNAMGETVIEERKIRIGGIPGEEDAVEQAPVTFNDDDIKSFASSMESDPDERRRQERARKTPDQLEDEEVDLMYSHILRRVQSEDLTDVARRNVIYQSGVDAAGRPIIVLVGMHMPMYTDTAMLERIMLYSVKLLDPIASSQEFVMVYLHANTPSKQQPEMGYMKQLYRIWKRKYTHNMTRMFIVHPTFWFKVSISIMKPFLADTFTEKWVFIDRLPELFEYLDHEQTKLPDQIYHYDHVQNGVPYNPDNNPANEGL